MTFRLPYAAATLALFATEVAIAAFVHDRFVRPHLGDTLAVVLLYLALSAVTRVSRSQAAAAALAIACALEIGQAFALVDRLGLGSNALARCLLGTGFDGWDFLAYVAGAGAALAVDRPRSAAHQLPNPGASLAPPGPSRVTRAAP